MASSPNVIQANDTNFATEVLQSELPVFVDFTADYCGPCKMIFPFVVQLADEYAGRVKVVKVDVEESPNTAAQCRVINLPTFLVFKGGEVVGKQAGPADKRRLERLFKEVL